MRVALLTHNARAGDAIGNQVAEKMAFFLARGAAVRVFLEDETRLHAAIRPHYQTIRGAAPDREAWAFISSADLVIAEYGQWYSLLDRVPLLAGGRPRVLLDYHAVTPREWWDRHNHEALEKGLRERGLVWCADIAVAHSRFACRELQEATRFPAERLFCLGHPLDTGHLSPGPPARPLNEELGLGPATLLLFVGRLAPNKRVPVLVEALARLRDLVPPVHAVVIGEDGDVYQDEARRSRERAARLGVGDRLHLLGHVDADRLRDAYRSAHVFVMPSRHEGFCIPVAEAMACGLPVVAARAGALPETVAPAGLTFTPDDADDLAGQVRRVLQSRAGTGGLVTATRGIVGPQPRTVQVQTLRVAVVAFRYGTDFAGGAETSLRTIAGTLCRAGHHVEVFTTCTIDESHWSDHLPEGTSVVAGVPVHRFRIDPHDRARHLDSVRGIVNADGAVSREAEAEYLANSIHSGRLIEELGRRIDGFDAVITGPYLHGLTVDVARTFAEKTVLLPCFHDEPFARLPALREAYERVGGILYHSREEQGLAETTLGLHHPGARCCGTVLDTEPAGDAARGRARIGGGRRYVLYCGRYSSQKNLPALLEYARRYAAAQPGRFTFAFVGQGDVAIPREPWTRDLGFVDERTRRDVAAGADLVIQLSANESLSLVALEAWAQGVPVLASARCDVLRGHLTRCDGGRAVYGYEDFAAALDDLWQDPQGWRAAGLRGREYVRTSYGSVAAFTAVLTTTFSELTLPLAERMRRRGLEKAAHFTRSAWSRRFATLVEDLLHAPLRPLREDVRVRVRVATRTVAAGTDAVLVPVEVTNQGTHPAIADGPARVIVRCRVFDETGGPVSTTGEDTRLPGLLIPGQSMPAAATVPVPTAPGNYRVNFSAERAMTGPAGRQPPADSCTAVSTAPCTAAPGQEMRLVVQESAGHRPEDCCAPLLAQVHSALAEAARLQQLPDQYLDITEGRFARWKRWIKHKLLNNFKRAYVDVLSRQQSAWNRRLVAAVAELAESCAVLDHAARLSREARQQDQEVLAALRSRVTELEQRLSRLEAERQPQQEVTS
ncbi:MAG TPA: glycosyltransferase [Gemmataceae bacterium]|nr:glycosyltransferase [Gemmataceae bacterium]